MYSIEYRQDKNALVLIAGGFFTPEEGEGFTKEYKKNVSKINPAITKLILDGSKLKTSTQDMLATLKSLFEMYINDGFKEIYMVKYESAITNSQVSRLGSETGLMDKVKMIDSIEDAFNA